VCSANQCRSPIAEHLLRHAVASRDLDWQIGSAGTSARDGKPMHELAAAVLQERGIEVGEWRSRRLTSSIAHRADLILTARTVQRREVVCLEPSAIPRTFSIVQFARLARRVSPIDEQDGAALGLELVWRAAASRHHLQPASAGAEDICDPMGDRVKGFRRCAETIQDAIDQIMKPIDGRHAEFANVNEALSRGIAGQQSPSQMVG
jgi:protein-tyrosine phosphatase